MKDVISTPRLMVENLAKFVLNLNYFLNSTFCRKLSTYTHNISYLDIGDIQLSQT